MRGQVVMRDEKISFNNLRFNTFGGGVIMNGSYATPNPESPDVHLRWKLDNVDILDAYGKLSMLEDLAPVLGTLPARVGVIESLA